MKLHKLSIFLMVGLGYGCSASEQQTTKSTPLNDPSVEVEVPNEQAQDAPNLNCPWTIKDGRALNDSFTSDVAHSIVEVDLDGEGRLDVIANLKSCGNHGDCMFVVLRACDGDGYAAIWGPEYAQGMTIIKAHPKRPVLGYISRTDAPECDVPLFTPLTLGYGAKWQPGVSCTDGTGVWEETCGQRYPLCETAS